MGWFQKLRDKRARNKEMAVQEVSGQRLHNPLCSTAENVFAQLRPLVDELKIVQPYGVSQNGTKLALTRTPELMALSNPNDDMGWAEFADLAFSTWLTEKELNIHVWKNQRGQVYGYTVLPVNSRHVLGDRVYFTTTLGNGETVEYSRDEVMTLRFSRNPRNIDEGVSPGIASLIWSQIDDVLAQYQLGHFENGAVPAYITIIRASSREKYLEKRKDLEAGFHGARNKGKTLYLWRQFLDDGSERDEVEVKTIQGSNASLAIKDIMSIVNDKLNKAFGVSNFILGDDSSAKYDNAELSQQQFLSHRVYPALYCFWDQFQHELARIKGGKLDYSISFDLQIPELTDRLKVKAETKKIEAETQNLKVQREQLEEQKNKLLEETKKIKAETINVKIDGLKSLIASGATPEAALSAMELPSNWQPAADALYGKDLIQSKASTAEAVNDSHNCSHHTCDDLPQFSPDEVIERGIYDELVSLADALVDGELGISLGLTADEISELINRIIDQLIEISEKGLHESQTQIIQSIRNMTWNQNIGKINEQPVKSKKELLEAMESDENNIDQKTAEDLVKDKLNTRVEEIIKNYQDEVKDFIRNTISTSGNSKSAAEISTELKEHLPTARAEMIARNETVHAFRLAKLEEARAQADKYGLKMQKVWQAHPGGCPICESMDGVTVGISEAFPAEQVNEDGHIYAYDHNIYNENGDTPNAHVNCRCSFLVEVVDG